MARDEEAKTKKKWRSTEAKRSDRTGLGAVRGTTKKACMAETSGENSLMAVMAKEEKEKACSVRVAKRTQENTEGYGEEGKRLQAFE